MCHRKCSKGDKVKQRVKQSCRLANHLNHSACPQGPVEDVVDAENEYGDGQLLAHAKARPIPWSILLALGESRETSAHGLCMSLYN